jgi:DNA-binding MarR family transcriptional regulator
MMASAHPDEGHRPGLTALLSALLVAFTIEFDNEFEHRMPHRTTRHGRTAGAGPRPWLISMAMWVHVMRLVPEDGISAGDLVRLSQLTPKSMLGLIKRVGQWWGYLELGPDPADQRAKVPAAEWLVRPTKAGRKAQSIWAPLTDEIEARWNDRFSQKAVEDLRAALTDVVARLDVDLPDYLLILGEPRLASRQPAKGGTQLPLTALLSKLLLALALDFDDHSDLSLEIYTSGVGSRLPICANVLRLIGDDGVGVAKIPELSGVDKMAIDNWARILIKRGYLDVATDPGGGGRRVALLTPKGVRARDAYFQWTESLEGRWPDARSSAVVRRLRRAAEQIVGATGPGSPLWEGMEPYPDGWRSDMPPRQVLPDFPVVTVRGGFPDGS